MDKKINDYTQRLCTEKNDIDCTYQEKKDEEDCFDASIQKLEKYIKMSKERLITYYSRQ